MLIRRHLPNGRSNHCEITKPLIFKGLKQKHRVCDQRLNYRPIYTINTDIQSVTRSALESDKWHSKWYSTQQCLTEKAESEIVPKTTPPISVCLYFTQYIFHLVRFGTRFGTRVPCFICKSGESYQCHPRGRHFSKAQESKTTIFRNGTIKWYSLKIHKIVIC